MLDGGSASLGGSAAGTLFVSGGSEPLAGGGGERAWQLNVLVGRWGLGDLGDRLGFADASLQLLRPRLGSLSLLLRQFLFGIQFGERLFFGRGESCCGCSLASEFLGLDYFSGQPGFRGFSGVQTETFVALVREWRCAPFPPAPGLRFLQLWVPFPPGLPRAPVLPPSATLRRLAARRGRARFLTGEAHQAAPTLRTNRTATTASRRLNLAADRALVPRSAALLAPPLRPLAVRRP